MSMNKEEKYYLKTSEISLAATLICYGFSLDHLDPTESNRLLFVFKRNGNGDLDILIQAFWADTLTVSPKKYFYILKELKARVFAERRIYSE